MMEQEPRCIHGAYFNWPQPHSSGPSTHIVPLQCPAADIDTFCLHATWLRRRQASKQSSLCDQARGRVHFSQPHTDDSLYRATYGSKVLRQNSRTASHASTRTTVRDMFVWLREERNFTQKSWISGHCSGRNPKLRFPYKPGRREASYRGPPVWNTTIYDGAGNFPTPSQIVVFVW